MANSTETDNQSGNTNNANNASHYGLMTVGIFIGFFGIMLRFVTDWSFADAASNIILIIGVIIGLKSVFNILK